ncbi:MAG: acyl-CoA dehydrogenase family protein [Desulfatibacillaceae bacterium]
MPDQVPSFGLFAEAPDLRKSVPSLERLARGFPAYVARAERAQCMAREVARDVILPKSLELDKKCHEDPTYVDWDLWRELNRRKLTVSIVPERMGGLGWGFFDMYAAMEEFVAADVGTTALFMFNLFWTVCAFVEFRADVCLSVMRSMVEAQKRGEPLFFAWALTEANCGTDNLNRDALATQRPTMRVDRVAGGWRINGSKHFISNGSLAHNVLVVAPTDPDNPLESFACFYVPTDSDGFSVGRVERKMGHKAKPTAELVLRDVFVPDENVWEPPGRGWRHTSEILAISTGAVGMLGVGMARGALERCVRFASGTRVGGRRLIEDNRVQVAIGRMLERVMTIRARCFDFAIGADALMATRLLDSAPVRAGLAAAPSRLLLGESLAAIAGKGAVCEATSRYKHRLVPDETVERVKAHGSAVKVAGTDLAMEVSSAVLDLVGLEGMDHRHGMEKVFRDAKVAQIYEGTNQVNLLGLFKHELGKGAGL